MDNKQKSNGQDQTENQPYQTESHYPTSSALIERIAALQEIVSSNPNDWTSAIELAELFFKSNQTNKVNEILRPLDPGMIELESLRRNKYFCLFSLSQFQSGDLAEAEKTCQKGLEEFPNSLDCYFVSSFIKSAFREYDAAIEAAITYIKLHEKIGSLNEGQDNLLGTSKHLAEIECLLGNAYKETNQIDQALSHFELAAKADPGNAAPYLGLALIHLHNNDNEKAREVVKVALSECPENEELKIMQKSLNEFRPELQRLKEMLDGGDKEEADREAHRMIERSPDKLEAIDEIANLFFENNDFAYAAKFFWLKLNSSPNDPYVLNNLANCFFKLENYEKALEYYEMASELPEAPLVSFRNLGETCCKVKQYGSAIIAFRRYLSKYPDDANVLSKMAELYSRTGDYRTALPFFEKSFEVNSSDHNSLFGLSECHLNLGQEETAIKGYKKALELKPDFELAKKRLKQLEAVVSDS